MEFKLPINTVDGLSHSGCETYSGTTPVDIVPCSIYSEPGGNKISPENELKKSFAKNGLPYTLLKRNELVALNGVGGTYTKKILHYEVCRITIQKENYRFGKHFDACETIPGNEKFGKEGSRAILKYEDALKYYDEFTNTLKMLQEGKRVVALTSKPKSDIRVPFPMRSESLLNIIDNE